MLTATRQENPEALAKPIHLAAAPAGHSTSAPSVTVHPGRRRWRKLLGVAVMTLIAVVVLVGPWPAAWVDDSDRPLVGEQVAEHVLLEVGPLEVGAASVALDASRADLPLAGYASRAFSGNDGPADEIAVRAIALRRGNDEIIIVAADLLLFNRTLVEAVGKRLRRFSEPIARSQVYFTATHTHSSVGGYAGSFAETFALGRRDDRAIDDIAERIARTIDQARRNRVGPCEIGHSAVEVDPQWIRNRVVPSEEANRWLDAVVFRQCGGPPIATLLIFSAHATTRPATDRRISADYPGTLVRALENSVGGVVAFAAGAVGSMAPGEIGPRDQRASTVGLGLAQHAEAAIRSIQAFDSQPRIALSAFALRLPTPAVKLTRHLVVSPIAARRLLPAQIEVTFLELGPCVLIGTPCDYSGVLAGALRGHAMPGRPTPIVTSFSGDYIGYTMPSRYYDLDRYEPKSMAFYGRRFGDRFAEWLAWRHSTHPRTAFKEPRTK